MKPPQLITDIRSAPVAWKLWTLILFTLNIVGGVAFIDSSAGRSAIVSLIGASIVMAIIYLRFGFVRLIGLGRILFWLPMEVEFSLDLIEGYPQGLLLYWLISILCINGVSIAMDLVNVIRFVLIDSHVTAQSNNEAPRNKNNSS